MSPLLYYVVFATLLQFCIGVFDINTPLERPHTHICAHACRARQKLFSPFLRKSLGLGALLTLSLCEWLCARVSHVSLKAVMLVDSETG